MLFGLNFTLISKEYQIIFEFFTVQLIFHKNSQLLFQKCELKFYQFL